MAVNPRPLRIEEVGGMGGFDPIASFLKPRMLHEELKQAMYDNMLKKAKADFADKNAAEEYNQLLNSGIIKKAEADVAPQMSRAGLEKMLMGNKIMSPQAEHAEENFMADLLRKQLGNKESGLDIQGKQIDLPFRKENLMQNLNKMKLGNEAARMENQFSSAKLPYAQQLAAAELSNKQRLGTYGSGALTAGAKEEIALDQSVKEANPGFNQQQIRDASEQLRQGKSTLSDGTPFNLTEKSVGVLDRIERQRSGSATVNNAIKFAQADAELGVLEKEARNLSTNYGDAYFGGVIPEAFIDSYKSDDSSQRKLGKLLGANALNYEIAQLRNRQAGGEPGISATNMLMGHSGQIINTKFPRLSRTAREEASKVIDEALKKGLTARQKVRHPSDIYKIEGYKGGQKEGSSEGGSNNNDPLGIR